MARFLVIKNGRPGWAFRWVGHRQWDVPWTEQKKKAELSKRELEINGSGSGGGDGGDNDGGSDGYKLIDHFFCLKIDWLEGRIGNSVQNWISSRLLLTIDPSFNVFCILYPK